MEQVARVIDVRDVGAVAAIQDLLWRLMENDVVQGLLVALQTHPNEAPAPTLIKNRERLERANPLAPVMTLNCAKIVGMLLAQESGKQLAAVMRPCEARALAELSGCDQLSLDDLLTVSIDCLGSHDEVDYQQRATLWGDDVPTQESLRWSRRGQIAPYRFRQACQVCEQPYFDQAHIVIGLLGQDVTEEILIFMESGLAEQVGLADGGWTRPATGEELIKRRTTIAKLVAQRQVARRRLLAGMREKAKRFRDFWEIFESCTLCGECQEACPLTTASGFDINGYKENTPEYVADRILDIVRRSELCVGCGMCEMVCHLGIPLTLITQLLADQVQIKHEILAALTGGASESQYRRAGSVSHSH